MSGPRRREREALRLWDENREAQQGEANKGRLSPGDFSPGNKAAFVRLYGLTGWEDLSISLAPALAREHGNPGNLSDKRLREFIDVQVADPTGLVLAPSAKQLLHLHGWEAVSRMLRSR